MTQQASDEATILKNEDVTQLLAEIPLGTDTCALR